MAAPDRAAAYLRTDPTARGESSSRSMRKITYNSPMLGGMGGSAAGEGGTVDEDMLVETRLTFTASCRQPFIDRTE